MQILRIQKRILSILLIAVLCFGLLAALGTSAQAAEILPQELYLEQSRGGICTMTSAAMLLRSALYVNGSSHWSEIGEREAANACWLWGQGIMYQWSFETDYASISVERTELYGITAEELKAVLDAHPEGIEFYCGNVPHAVFLTDYEGDTFYCADPAPYNSCRRIPLADSWNGYRLGGTQDAVLRNATAYWAITDMEITADMDEIPLDAIRADALKSQTRQLMGSDNAWITEALLPAKEAAHSTDGVLQPVSGAPLPAKETALRPNDGQIAMCQ